MRSVIKLKFLRVYCFYKHPYFTVGGRWVSADTRWTQGSGNGYSLIPNSCPINKRRLQGDKILLGKGLSVKIAEQIYKKTVETFISSFSFKL